MIHDQTTDRSGAELVKIANRLADRDLAETALNTLFSMKRTMSKTASFPVDTPEDVLLSRIYFEGQRDQLDKEAAEFIDGRLAVRETLHGMSIDASTRPEPKSTPFSKEAAFELCPDVKVASDEDFVRAGRDFETCRHFMSQDDLLEFAGNYHRLAKEAGLASVESVELIAGDNVVPNEAMVDNMHLRKVAMERSGRNNAAYAALYEVLRSCDACSMPVSDLRKLAREVDMVDRCNGLAGYGGLPDAWHSFLRVKTAEETESMSGADKFEGMTKADIVGRYGDGILAEVEDPETGEIDREHLKDIVRELGLDGENWDTDTSEGDGE